MQNEITLFFEEYKKQQEAIHKPNKDQIYINIA